MTLLAVRCYTSRSEIVVVVCPMSVLDFSLRNNILTGKSFLFYTSLVLSLSLIIMTFMERDSLFITGMSHKICMSGREGRCSVNWANNNDSTAKIMVSESVFGCL